MCRTPSVSPTPRSFSVRMAKTGSKIPARDLVGLNFISKASKVAQSVGVVKAVAPSIKLKTAYIGLLFKSYDLRLMVAAAIFRLRPFSIATTQPNQLGP